MKTTATLAQVGFIAVAALGVYAFVGAAQRDMRRASCSALCRLGRRTPAPTAGRPTSSYPT